jgi:hypothetical protein
MANPVYECILIAVGHWRGNISVICGIIINFTEKRLEFNEKVTWKYNY